MWDAPRISFRRDDEEEVRLLALHNELRLPEGVQVSVLQFSEEYGTNSPTTDERKACFAWVENRTKNLESGVHNSRYLSVIRRLRRNG